MGFSEADSVFLPDGCRSAFQIRSAGLFLLGIGLQGAVEQSFPYGFVFLEILHCLRTEGALCQSRPNVINGLCGGMMHVLGIEAIVPQFVKQNLVRGEIVADIGEAFAHRFYSKQKHRF